MCSSTTTAVIIINSLLTCCTHSHDSCWSLHSGWKVFVYVRLNTKILTSFTTIESLNNIVCCYSAKWKEEMNEWMNEISRIWSTKLCTALDHHHISRLQNIFPSFQHLGSFQSYRPWKYFIHPETLKSLSWQNFRVKRLFIELKQPTMQS